MLATILSILIPVIIILWLGKLTFMVLDLEESLNYTNGVQTVCIHEIKKIKENIDDDFR